MAVRSSEGSQSLGRLGDVGGERRAFLGVPAGSVAPDAVDEHFGWIGRFFGMDITASSARTRELLGWTPTGPTLLEDIAAGAYALT